MNVGITGGVAGSAAGAPLSQNAGAEAERAQKESNVQQRLADSQNKSEKASGIGATEEDQQASERDADGRRLLERTENDGHADQNETDAPRQGKDPTGLTGKSLDLTG